MKRKTIWWSLCGVMFLGFILTVGLSVKVMSASPEEPIRGGHLTIARTTNLAEGWDPVKGRGYAHLQPLLLALKRADFYRGAAGTKELNFYYPFISPHGMNTRGLAKKWEMSGPATIRYFLNEGIKWHNKAPMNGRPVTAQDLVWGYERLMKFKASGLPTMSAKPISMRAIDDFTFEWTLAQPDMRTAFTIDDWYRIAPREVIEKYGNMDDWRNVVGNGPFMLKNYVAGKKIEYVRNPDYWETDLEGRKVPFIDGFTTMIITDDSTRWAALRTGKIDIVHAVPWRDAVQIIKSSPQIKNTGSIPWNPVVVQFNVQDKIYSDLRVRRAMTLAVDHMAIVEDMHDGNSAIIPSAFFAPGHPAFMKLDDYPESVREIYGYNPEKAKKLLAEAGYPKGFKGELSTMQLYADYASILVSYWNDIGLDIKINVMEAGAYVSKLYGLKLPLLLRGGGLSGPRNSSWQWTKGAPWNFSDIRDDQKLFDLFAVATAEKNPGEFGNEWQAAVKYLVSQVYEHQIPGPNRYHFWQPWVRNFSGEISLGRTDYSGYAAYIWVDKTKKK